VKCKGEIKHYERQYEQNNYRGFVFADYCRIAGNFLGRRTEAVRSGAKGCH
jgi:hypothetical protein